MTWTVDQNIGFGVILGFVLGIVMTMLVVTNWWTLVPHDDDIRKQAEQSKVRMCHVYVDVGNDTIIYEEKRWHKACGEDGRVLEVLPAP